jgi:hypothetical protein
LHEAAFSAIQSGMRGLRSIIDIVSPELVQIAVAPHLPAPAKAGDAGPGLFVGAAGCDLWCGKEALARIKCGQT